MRFYDVGVQDPIIGHVSVSNIWPADEFARLCRLYERAKAVLVETMEKVPPLPADYKFEWSSTQMSTTMRAALQTHQT